MTIPRICLYSVCLVMMLSCSSAPPQDEATDVRDKAVEYTESGNTYYSQAKYQDALTFFTLALERNISIDNDEGVARSYYSIGKVYISLESFDMAQEMFQTAFSISERINSNSLIFQYYNSMGELYLAQYEVTGMSEKAYIDQSAEMFLNALAVSEAGIVKKALSILYHNLGTLNKKQGNFEDAHQYLDKAVDINLQLKRHAEVGANYYLISSLYSKQQQYDQAYEFALKALEYDKKAENSLGIAKDLFALGIIKQRLDDNTEAFDFFKKAYMIYQIFTLPAEMQRLLPYLIESAEKADKKEEQAYYRFLLEEQENY